MTKSLVASLSLTLCLLVGCGKKDADKAAAGDKPPAAPADKPAAAAADKPATGAASAADLPAECKPFMEALEALTRCDKIPAESRTQMKDGNQQMLKAMIDLGDKKAMIDGCQTGLSSLQQALKVAGC